jgi:hypothetical protein
VAAAALPGRYLINAPQSGDRSRVVVVQPQETITLNFLNTCLL